MQQNMLLPVSATTLISTMFDKPTHPCNSIDMGIYNIFSFYMYRAHGDHYLCRRGSYSDGSSTLYSSSESP
jgi:hypothetical protein